MNSFENNQKCSSILTFRFLQNNAKQIQKPSQEPKRRSEKMQQQQSSKKTGKKGETLLALQWKKGENFAQWYTDVIVLSEMISYYDISGCYILRPWSYTIWELIQEWFNVEVRLQ